VAMPDRLAVAESADGNVAFLHVRDDVDLGKLREERLAVRIRPGWIELAEAAAEREELRVGEALAAETQHQELVPRFLYRGERFRRDGLAQVDAAHLRAKRGGKR